jgi:hypothetical protein
MERAPQLPWHGLVNILMSIARSKIGAAPLPWPARRQQMMRLVRQPGGYTDE